MRLFAALAGLPAVLLAAALADDGFPVNALPKRKRERLLENYRDQVKDDAP